MSHKHAERGWVDSHTEPVRLVLLRHGQTSDSLHHLFSGGRGTDPELTDEGLAQAQLAVKHLAESSLGQSISAIMSSPMTRTRQTTQCAASVLNLDISTDERLREIDFGLWEGRTLQDIKEQWPEEFQQWSTCHDFAAPDGESIGQVEARVTEFAQEMVQRNSGRTILVVSHVTPIKALLRCGLGEAPQFYTRTFLDLASISVVDFFPGDTATVRLVNHGFLR